MAEEAKSGKGEPGTEEAEALAAALNHSAERVQTLWFKFLTFMFALAVAVGKTSHLTLFLESPLKLPVVLSIPNISLLLLAFYALTPVIFVTFHFYMLLNLVLLARTAKSFEDALVSGTPDDGEREAVRVRIENTLFVQLLVGGRPEREGFNAKLLSLVALTTLAVAPVALLLFLEVKFLPYHSEWITWLHRGLLALDLMLVWTLWPGYRSGWGVRLWPKWSWRLVGPGVLSVMALAYVVVVATFPDEHMYLATNLKSGEKPDWYASIAPVNTLDLHGEDLIDDAKLTDIIKKNEGANDAQRWVATLSLAGRDLTGANLEGADVRHVDFSSAILNRANLSQARAKNAHFDGVMLDASLVPAQLQGASLVSTHLQGASLDNAYLQGASLQQADLQGASLLGAQLQGAWLNFAQLQGASLVGTQLQGAWLVGAQLQGASLLGAQLQGASLDLAKLQGSSLDYAQLQGASFVHVCAWRADARQAAWENTRVELPTSDTIHDCDWTAASLAALEKLIPEKFPEGDERRAAMEWVEQRFETLEGENEMAKIWAARERETPAPEVYEKSLAGQWREAGCAAEGAPYVLRALIARLRFYSRFPEQRYAAKALAAAFLDEAPCPGLSEADKATLKKIAVPAAPPAPKP